jgi:hypothetical protein
MTEQTEEKYLVLLKHQRHMYKWCLQNIGNLPEGDARKEAETFYKYEPVEEKHRWIVFHEDAWHWAMLKLKGENWWLDFPELKEANTEYNMEWKKFENAAEYT